MSVLVKLYITSWFSLHTWFGYRYSKSEPLNSAACDNRNAPSPSTIVFHSLNRLVGDILENGEMLNSTVAPLRRKLMNDNVCFVSLEQAHKIRPLMKERKTSGRYGVVDMRSSPTL